MMAMQSEPTGTAAATRLATVWLLYGYTPSGARVLLGVYTTEDRATEAAEGASTPGPERSHDWISWNVEARATDVPTPEAVLR